MTPRRVKRRSGSRANNSVRRSRRSYRNAGYMSSSASLPREPRISRPTSAHSSYSNFHAARPASYHTVERERATPTESPYDPPSVSESVPIVTNRQNIKTNTFKSGQDVAGPYKEPVEPPTYDTNAMCGNLSARIDNIARDWECEGWQEPPPPAPPYLPSAQAQSPQYGNLAPYGHNTPPPTSQYPLSQYEPHAVYHARYAQGTPVSPGPPAYQAANEIYTNLPPCQ